MSFARRFFLTMAVVVALLYAGVCGALFAFQRSLIYFPQSSSNHQGIPVMTLPVEGETVRVSTKLQPGSDAVIYFGGNAEDVSQDMPDMEAAFPNTAIYLLHYPGYGGSSGSPSQ